MLHYSYSLLSCIEKYLLLLQCALLFIESAPALLCDNPEFSFKYREFSN